MARLPEGALMQRAAAGLARRVAQLLEDEGGVYGAHVLLLVGAGNNGGDALYAGARLARRGARVDALLLNPERAHQGGLAALRQAGGSAVDRQPSTVDIVLDGIVGIGGKGGLRPDAREAIQKTSGTVIAVDVPSGVDVGQGAAHAGIVELVDIGLEPAAPPALHVATADDIRDWWPRPGRDSDKYTRGVVGVATGSATYPGAAVLSVAGACAGPAGMVRYAGAAAEYVRMRHPSVIATERVADAGRVQAWVCGSGLGTDEHGRQELRAVLATKVPLCLDADALTLLAEEPRRPGQLVVTPHDREFARLAGEPPGPDRVGSALRLATKLQATVLLKGDRTVVAAPDGTVWVNPTGTAALATAGSGDVLSGLLGALLAGGLPPMRAAVAAAYVHGLAGRRAAEGGPVTASDVADAVRVTAGDVTRR
ncbi:MAG: NAD(P)H-hydrate dehydratase [Actinobacteria bacterium 13_1_20CM_3_71_11]|nr:MAG: NAD(P)H-hydrate dehydratase [Actinobacteria bacterium 13_1_20CM_3_71_11]